MVEANVEVNEQDTISTFKIENAEQYSTVLATELLEKPEIYTAIRDFHIEQNQAFEKLKADVSNKDLKLTQLETQLAKEVEAKEKAMGLVYETLKKIPIDTISKNEPEPFSIEKVVNQTLSDIENGKLVNKWVI